MHNEILLSDGPLIPTTWTDETKKRLVHYLTSFEYLHTLYAFRYLLCELLNFLNVVRAPLFYSFLHPLLIVYLDFSAAFNKLATEGTVFHVRSLLF